MSITSGGGEVLYSWFWWKKLWYTNRLSNFCNLHSVENIAI